MKTEEKMHQLCVHLSKHWTKQEHYEMERKLIFWKIDKNFINLNHKSFKQNYKS